MSAPRELPLRISKSEENDRSYSVKLAGVELSNVLLSDGLSIRFGSSGGGPSTPEVTMTFAAGSLDLDLDAELTNYLRALDAQAVTK